jgi:hypothetical protein
LGHEFWKKHANAFWKKVKYNLHNVIPFLKVVAMSAIGFVVGRHEVLATATASIHPTALASLYLPLGRRQRTVALLWVMKKLYERIDYKLHTALGIPALLALIMLTSQSAYANNIGGFDCYGEWRCASGWNHAIIQAQTDWDSGQYTKIPNGGNPDCFEGHTEAYCNGYTEGYTYEWNALYQWQQSQIPTGPDLGSQLQCINNNSPGATCILQSNQGVY